jgi:hypothetical protein
MIHDDKGNLTPMGFVLDEAVMRGSDHAGKEILLVWRPDLLVRGVKRMEDELRETKAKLYALTGRTKEDDVRDAKAKLDKIMQGEKA